MMLRKMVREKALSREEAEAKTSVWWDMKSIPIPSGFDAGRIVECMKSALEKLGYSGPVTISAYGDVHQTPDHVLRALSSTGIILYHSYYASLDLFGGLRRWKRLNPPPATIMLITHGGDANRKYGTLSHKKVEGYNIVVKYKWSQLMEGATDSESPDSKQEITRRQFILDKCSKTSESGESAPVYCTLCFSPAQSVESFIKHLKSEEHAEIREEYQRVLDMSKDVEMTSSGDDQASLDSHPNQPKKKIKTMKNCTIIPPLKTLVEANKVKKKLKKKKKKLMKKMWT